MVTIKNGSDIYYTHGDTFAINVEPDEFVQDTLLRFQIIQDEFGSPLITQTFNASAETESYDVRLPDVTTLPIGEYMYRMSLIKNNDIVTTTSGAFVVQWGVC